MQTTGHIWTKEEVQATTDLQREFNNYLNSFRSIVCYAAQTYGFYYEVSRLTDNMGDFTKQLKRSPANTLAVALSTQRNKIYRELMMNSVARPEADKRSIVDAAKRRWRQIGKKVRP